MKYWTRTTHNFNNQTREWEFKKELRAFEQHGAEMKSTLGIHALCSGRWQNRENENYYKQECQNPYSGVHPEGHSEASVLFDLNLMEQNGLVKSRES